MKRKETCERGQDKNQNSGCLWGQVVLESTRKGLQGTLWSECILYPDRGVSSLMHAFVKTIKFMICAFH